jgi:hypothetical protein
VAGDLASAFPCHETQPVRGVTVTRPDRRVLNMPSPSNLCPVRLATAEYIEKLSLAAASGSLDAWPILIAFLEGGKVPLPSEDLATTADSIRWAHATLLRRLEPRPPKRRRKWLCLLGPAYSSGLCVLCGVPVHSRLRHGEQCDAHPPFAHHHSEATR